MDIKLLVKLTSRAWALDILAHLHRGVPGRQATLLAATGAGRTAFGASLQHLMALGLVARNPGHGHPLRPEFILTAEGKAAAAKADAILRAAEVSAAGLLRKSWTVPVLALAARPQRFSGFKAGLGAITDRALSTSLQRLEAQDWVAREIDLSERVPFPVYRAVNAGGEISRVAEAAV
ncbi:winged helix-turn-helix transcriptional regulator [Shimia sp. MMG029]|uniref:winged helix-turn-helix transcriptional regulator n=1 Tax=Shimia sp. MMG029 TaxID=3021978 RepID=UPI0022FE7610|nr:winged helix-turn-helix transcriptional regulator [Shimia sp. MMG029]MDA5557195.1 winged helix-turn-helix transcriptional regulator [Shimia sp. MMG029]